MAGKVAQPASRFGLRLSISDQVEVALGSNHTRQRSDAGFRVGLGGDLEGGEALFITPQGQQCLAEKEACLGSLLPRSRRGQVLSECIGGDLIKSVLVSF